jgi:hypothetical protein
MRSNGEVEGPHRSAGPWRRGRTISERPRRQTRSASRTPPTIVRRHASTASPRVAPGAQIRSEGLVAAPQSWISTRHGARAGASPQDCAEARHTPPLPSGDDALQPHERRCARADATPEPRAGGRLLQCCRLDERGPRPAELRNQRAAGRTTYLPFPTTPCRAHRRLLPLQGCSGPDAGRLASCGTTVSRSRCTGLRCGCLRARRQASAGPATGGQIAAPNRS